VPHGAAGSRGIRSGPLYSRRKRLKVLIASPYALCTPHFETELEIAQQHLDAGDSVTFLCCDSDLSICQLNPLHDLYRCNLCIRMRQDGLKLLSVPIIQRPVLMLTQEDRKQLQKVRKEFLNLDDLKSYFIQNFDVGWATLSSLVDFLREPEPDLCSEPAKSLIENMTLCGAQIYFSILNYLREDYFDTVYIFNGRYFSLRPVFRACQVVGVKSFTHERGANKERYNLLEDTLPHDIDYTTTLIKRTWENAKTCKDREYIAGQFFNNARDGISSFWYSYTGEQTDGLLPSDWNESKQNLVIFVSSEDEYVAIGDTHTNPIYTKQNHGIQRIIKSLGEYPKIQIYLRVHPNLKGLDNSQVRFLRSLRSENLTVISAESPISSYSLMRNASKVLTFGSTTGVEAAFWGKPSILAGRSFYQDLGATYNPSSHDELLDMIHSDLPPKPKEGALMYGYYCSTYGTAFSCFRATDFFSGEFWSKKYNKFYKLSPNAHPIRSRLYLSYLTRQFRKIFPLPSRVHHKLR
jgi:hypothetical protein